MQAGAAMLVLHLHLQLLCLRCLAPLGVGLCLVLHAGVQQYAEQQQDRLCTDRIRLLHLGMGTGGGTEHAVVDLEHPGP
jgi:hypothetical protein